MCSEAFTTMFDNLAIACRQMLSGLDGYGRLADRGLSVLYGAPPAAIDLIMVSFQNHDCGRPLFDPAGQPWPKRLVHADDKLDPFPFGARLRRVFAAHGLTRTLSERTLAVNAIYPNAPAADAEIWLRGMGSYAAWRRFSTAWTALLVEQIRPKAVLLLGRKASQAIRHKLKGVPIVESTYFTAPTVAHDDGIYEAPFAELVRLLGAGR